ncbi:hypothetical protein DEA8626_01956 [Defluviimonas aquaemixtae]|uniref:Uncharacterized protein n=2 Tax=Albidovulum aquaemixtae TaxID=1542388 RepID=A0A2R8B700_9RHOB|nr:hypothetical protein DEA8626_01956 [Defluviimonas aquaemixtae]
MIVSGGSVRMKVLLALAALTIVAGCNRNRPQLTECVDGRPVVERVHDVAPPNC